MARPDRQYVARRAWEREALLRWATARAAAQLWAAFDFWRRRRWTAVQAEQAAQVRLWSRLPGSTLDG